jgi:hypothetical protein
MKLDDDMKENIFIYGSIAGIIFFLIVAFFFLVIVSDGLKLWTSSWTGKADLRKAEWTKRIQVSEAQGKMDAAKLLAKAEVERARGIAEANKIIGDSLKENESYLRYLWIESLQKTKDKVIYVPTEAGLPILESTRLNKK